MSRLFDPKKLVKHHLSHPLTVGSLRKQLEDYPAKIPLLAFDSFAGEYQEISGVSLTPNGLIIEWSPERAFTSFTVGTLHTMLSGQDESILKMPVLAMRPDGYLFHAGGVSLYDQDEQASVEDANLPAIFFDEEEHEPVPTLPVPARATKRMILRDQGATDGHGLYRFVSMLKACRVPEDDAYRCMLDWISKTEPTDANLVELGEWAFLIPAEDESIEDAEALPYIARFPVPSRSVRLAK